jgi:hypothetical protein
MTIVRQWLGGAGLQNVRGVHAHLEDAITSGCVVWLHRRNACRTQFHASSVEPRCKQRQHADCTASCSTHAAGIIAGHSVSAAAGHSTWQDTPSQAGCHEAHAHMLLRSPTQGHKTLTTAATASVPRPVRSRAVPRQPDHEPSVVPRVSRPE